MGGVLLERDAELDVLDAALHRAPRGSGSVVLISGEAGIGKTSRRARVPAGGRGPGGRAAGRVRRPADPAHPRPLRDAVRGRRGPLAAALAGGDRDACWPPCSPSWPDPRRRVLVLEDVHWADDATLDVLRYVGRRVDELPAVVVVTFRDEEVGRHLRAGARRPSAARRVQRLELRRLSPPAVAPAGRRHRRDVRAAVPLTGGNPFFVSEVVAAGSPAGRRARHGRRRRARPGAAASTPRQAALEQLAVVPSAVELPLARALLGRPRRARRGGASAASGGAPAGRRRVPARAGPPRRRGRTAGERADARATPGCSRSCSPPTGRTCPGWCTTPSRRATTRPSSRTRRSPPRRRTGRARTREEIRLYEELLRRRALLAPAAEAQVLQACATAPVHHRPHRRRLDAGTARRCGSARTGRPGRARAALAGLCPGPLGADAPRRRGGHVATGRRPARRDGDTARTRLDALLPRRCCSPGSTATPRRCPSAPAAVASRADRRRRCSGCARRARRARFHLGDDAGRRRDAARASRGGPPFRTTTRADGIRHLVQELGARPLHRGRRIHRGRRRPGGSATSDFYVDYLVGLPATACRSCAVTGTPPRRACAPSGRRRRRARVRAARPARAGPAPRRRGAEDAPDATCQGASTYSPRTRTAATAGPRAARRDRARLAHRPPHDASRGPVSPLQRDRPVGARASSVASCCAGAAGSARTGRAVRRLPGGVRGRAARRLGGGRAGVAPRSATRTRTALGARPSPARWGRHAWRRWPSSTLGARPAAARPPAPTAGVGPHAVIPAGPQPTTRAQPGRPYRPAGRDPASGRRGADERRDRRPPGRVGAHRRPPRVRGPAEARCHQQAGGGGHGRHIGPDVTAPPSG